MSRSPRTRRGAALLMVMTIVVLLLALVFTLSVNTVGNMQAEKTRDDQVELLASVESATNETVAWMSAWSGVLKNLPAHPEVVPAGLNTQPETQYTNCLTLAQQTPSAVIQASTYVATTQANGTPGPIIPAQTMLVNGQPVTIPGCAQGQINGDSCDAMIICLAQTPAGKTWPSGAERFLVIATATKGNKGADAWRFQTRRVMTIVYPQPTSTFQQTMYAISSYDVGGSAGTDSWNGTAVYTGNGISTHHGDTKSGGTVTQSGSSTIDGVIKSNFKLPMPTINYNPSQQANANNLGAVNAATTLAGGTDYRMSSVGSNAALTVNGSGSVTVYVDGPVDLHSIRFAPGSTASLVIIQNNYNSALGATTIDLTGNASVGDIAQVGNGNHATYTSENDPTVGPNSQRLQFYSGSSGSMTLNGTGQFAGVVYAPNMTINMNGTFQFFGSMVADSFGGKVNGTFNFHYDDRLGNMVIPIDPQFSAMGWNIYNVSLTQN
jgi:hypothetical protein